MFRRATLLIVVILFVCVSFAPSLGKARLIVVFPLRSTPALSIQARAASNAIVAKLGAIEGYDAQLMSEPKAGTLGAAAAATGAEIYVVGQLVEADNGFKIVLGSFSVATEQPINSYMAVTASPAMLPDKPDIKVLLAATTAAVQPAGPAKLLFVPYELPGSSDPYEIAASQNVLSALSGMSVPVARLMPMDGIDALANAAKICSDNGGNGLLIPDGRYQATMKPGFMSVTVNTHVDFRLVDASCDGVVRWSMTASGEDTVSGMNPNISGSVNAAYSAAVQRAASARATASIPQAMAAPNPSATAAAGPPGAYAVVPFDVLGMADQRKVDLTNSLIARLQAHGVQARATAPLDHFVAVAQAGQLCAGNAAQAVIVPSVRMEANSTSGSGAQPHAVLHLTALNCAGAIVARGVAQGSFRGAMLFFRDPDEAVVSATNDAMDAALAQLLQTRPANAASLL